MYAGLSGLAAASCDKCMMSSLTFFASLVAFLNLRYAQSISVVNQCMRGITDQPWIPVAPAALETECRSSTPQRGATLHTLPCRPMRVRPSHCVGPQAARTIRRLNASACPNRLPTSYLGPFGFQYPTVVPVNNALGLDAGIATVNHKLAPGHEARLLR